MKKSAKILKFKEAVEITSIEDVQANGTALRSSSAFTAGLLNALSIYQGNFKSKEQLAQLACDVEINLCCEPIDKQYQYASAYGGLNCSQFNSNSSVDKTKI